MSKPIREIIEDFDAGKLRLFIPHDASDEKLQYIAELFDTYSGYEPYTGPGFLNYFKITRNADPAGEYAFFNMETHDVYDAAGNKYFEDKPSRSGIAPVYIDELIAIADGGDSGLDSDFDEVWG